MTLKMVKVRKNRSFFIAFHLVVRTSFQQALILLRPSDTALEALGDVSGVRAYY